MERIQSVRAERAELWRRSQPFPRRQCISWWGSERKDPERALLSRQGHVVGTGLSSGRLWKWNRNCLNSSFESESAGETGIASSGALQQGWRLDSKRARTMGEATEIISASVASCQRRDKRCCNLGGVVSRSTRLRGKRGSTEGSGVSGWRRRKNSVWYACALCNFDVATYTYINRLQGPQ